MNYRYTLPSKLLVLVVGGLFSGFVFPDTFEFGRQNPILRNYFLQRCLEATSHIDRYGRRHYSGNTRFIERHADWLIDDFLAGMSKKLGALKTHFSEVQRAREEALSLAPNHEGRRKAQLRWKDSLKAVADQAEDLRKRLSFILMGLDNKSHFTPQIKGDANTSGFQSEIRFIEEQIAKAEQRINDYFFVPTHEVNVENLKGENMMIYLYQVRKMSKKLSEELKSG